MTTWEIPLPPDDLAMVWDKDGDPWMREKDGRGFPGGMWKEATDALAAADVRTWSRLFADFGPLTDYEPRCKALLTLGGPEEFRCLLAPNHSGHHKLPETCWSAP